MSILDVKSYGSGYDYEDFKKIESENIKEIIPGLLQVKSTESGKIDTYIMKLLIPIGETKTVVLTEETPENIKGKFSLVKDLKYSKILEIPEVDLSNLSFDTLTSKFQETTEKIKSQIESLFNKNK